MKTSDKGVAFIAAHEGVVTKAYRDSVGVWTIGVGHSAAAGPPKPVAGMTITRQQALDIFTRDLAKFETRVSKALPNVPQHAFDAGASFDFNTGAIHKASWVPAYLAGKLDDARARFLSWNKPAVIKGRRRDEARLLFDGVYGPAIDVALPPPAGANPAEATHPADVIAYQQQLATLGLYKGPIDGNGASVITKAAVLVYQQSHPDLVDDGVVGPATRASLARDVAARTLPTKTGAAGGVVVVAAGGAVAATGHPWLWVAIGAAALVAVGIVFAIVRKRVSR